MPVMDDTAPLNPSALSRQQILDATARCLREDGYDACTIRRIAGRLDCAVGSIYRYYRDKRDLLYTVAQAALEPAAALVEAGGSVEVSARLYYDLVAAEPSLYPLMFWLAAVGEGTSAAQAPHALAGTDALPRVVRRIITGWSHRLGDGDLATRCWLMVHGCVTLGVSAAATLEKVNDQLGHRAASGNGKSGASNGPGNDAGNSDIGVAGSLKLPPPPIVTRAAALHAATHDNGDEPRPLRPALGIFSDHGEDQTPVDVDGEQTNRKSKDEPSSRREASRSAREAVQEEKTSGAQAMPDDVVLL